MIGQSEYISSYSYVTRITTQDNYGVSPEGLTNSTAVFNTAQSGSHNIAADAVSFTSGTTYTFSVFVKAGTISKVRLSIVNALSTGVDFDLSDGTATGTGSDIQNYGNGWYRCIYTFSATSTTTNGRAWVALVNNDGNLFYLGSISEYIELYGFQVEQGSYPTSYIPNHSGGSATRTADQPLGLTNAGTDGILNNYNTSFFAETKEIFSSLDLKRIVTIFADNSVANPRILLYVQSNNLILQYRVTGQSDLFIQKSGIDLDAVNKFAVVINDTTLSLYHNGSLYQSSTIVKGDNLEELKISEESGFFLNQFLVFPESLSQADAETLTTL